MLNFHSYILECLHMVQYGMLKKSISAHAQALRVTPCGFGNKKTFESCLVKLHSTTTPAVLQGLVRHL